MKHVTGFPNLAGTRITTVALWRLQSRMSGVTAVEQIKTRAVSIVSQRAGENTCPVGAQQSAKGSIFRLPKANHPSACAVAPPGRNDAVSILQHSHNIAAPPLSGLSECPIVRRGILKTSSRRRTTLQLLASSLGVDEPHRKMVLAFALAAAGAESSRGAPCQRSARRRRDSEPRRQAWSLIIEAKPFPGELAPVSHTARQPLSGVVQTCQRRLLSTRRSSGLPNGGRIGSPLVA